MPDKCGHNSGFKKNLLQVSVIEKIKVFLQKNYDQEKSEALCECVAIKRKY